MVTGTTWDPGPLRPIIRAYRAYIMKFRNVSACGILAKIVPVQIQNRHGQIHVYRKGGGKRERQRHRERDRETERETEKREICHHAQ